MFGLAHRPHGYLTFAAHLAGPLYERVAADVAAHPLPPQARVLDAGTGPGVLPLKIAAVRPGLLLDAVDLSPDMIGEARRNAERSGQPDAVTFTVADVARLPFPDATFDLVVSTISQHHWQDPAAGLQDILRVLRPGGRAWVYDFRLALRRARRAATTLPEGVTVTVESPLPGARWLSPIGRLVLIAGGTPQP
jgi:ubiquinone/menaquinone biosynthesis C-methylase UbiE